MMVCRRLSHQFFDQNVQLEQSPTRIVAAQTIHFFAALCAYVKFEILKYSTTRSYSALNLSIQRYVLVAAFEKLCALKTIHFITKPFSVWHKLLTFITRFQIYFRLIVVV